MTTTNLDPLHAGRVTRGAKAPTRAASTGVDVSDGTNEVSKAQELRFPGGNVVELDDGIAQITIGGGNGSGSSATAVQMLNNSGTDLSGGAVVVVDETADRAVTTTTDEASTRIAGVVQEPIPAGEIGPVLFNGYAAAVSAIGTVTRGQYAQTSATAGSAQGTDTREAGSFGVFLTGLDVEDFVEDSRVTQQPVAGTSLDIDMPVGLAAGRILFLALWLDSGTSDTDVTGWTRIGSEAGFRYFYKVSTGTDTATATWTGSSAAVAAVLMLTDQVSLADPVQDFDYDDTTTAAALTGLSDNPRYALAVVQEEASTPDGWTLHASGEYVPGGDPPAVVQSAENTNRDDVDATFPTGCTAGNVMLAFLVGMGSAPSLDGGIQDGGYNGSGWVHLGSLQGDAASELGTLHARIYGKTSVGGETKVHREHSNADIAMTILEVSGISLANIIDSAQLDNDNQGNPATFDLGTLTGTGFAVMLTTWGRDHGATTDFSTTPASGWTEITDRGDGSSIVTGGHMHVQVKNVSGSTGTAITVTETGGAGVGTGGGVAFLFGTDAPIKGTLVGKYIGHADSVSSPFSGTGLEDDGVFALNLVADPKPSVLLYGPDLGVDDGGSHSHDADEITYDNTTSGLTATDVQAAIDEVAAGGGVALSDDTPLLESGSGSAGTASEASRSDHVHPDAGSVDGWTTVRKSADESVSSNTSVQNDDHLFFTAASGTVYEIDMMVVYASPAGGTTPGFKFDVGEDATLRGAFTIEYISGAGAATSAVWADAQTGTGGIQTATTKRALHLHGWHSGNGGTWRLRWAQTTSGANATTVYTGSYLKYRAAS